MSPAEIRSARQALGMTQAQFAIFLHAKERTVQDWEGGRRNMPASTEELLSLKTRDRFASEENQKTC